MSGSTAKQRSTFRASSSAVNSKGSLRITPGRINSRTVVEPTMSIVCYQEGVEPRKCRVSGAQP